MWCVYQMYCAIVLTTLLWVCDSSPIWLSIITRCTIHVVMCSYLLSSYSILTLCTSQERMLMVCVIDAN